MAAGDAGRACSRDARHPGPKQEWEQRQEANLAYVAITRAQRELVYVN